MIKCNFLAIQQWVIDRLREKSTWAGIVTVAVTLLGTQIAPAKADAIELVGVVFASAVAVGTKAQTP